MGFYDSVKDDIRQEKGEQPAQDADEEGDDDMPFDHLKDGAKSDDDEDQQGSGSDTQIEVLTDEGLKPADEGQETQDASGADAAPASGQQRQQETADPQPAETQESPGQAQDRSAPDADAETAGADHDPARDAVGNEPDDDLLAALQRIERQNDDMLDVLRGIKRSLDS